MSDAQANALARLECDRRRDWRMLTIILAVLCVVIILALVAGSCWQKPQQPTGFVILTAAVGQGRVIVAVRDIMVVAPAAAKDGRVYGAIQLRGQKGLLVVGETPEQVWAAMAARR